MRRIVTFPCTGETLVGTLDEAAGPTGVLIVSGGNELRIGAHRGMAELAMRLAVAGVPVLRFDRRGIGDSSGENEGYATSGPDIAAASAAFRSEASHLTRLVGFGNCDAATALALFPADLDALVLSNPWVVEDAGDLPPPAAIRSRYAERLKDPRALWRLVTGGVNIGKLAKGLRSAMANDLEVSGDLPSRVARTLEAFAGPITLLLARRDNTAIAFDAAWRSPDFAGLQARVSLHRCDTASHSYQHRTDQGWLVDRLGEATTTI